MAKVPTLADVLAAPDDLDLRMVWADALQQQGDPRGELAALQLAKTQTYEGWVRERELVDRYGSEWMGPLGRYLGSPIFEGGVCVGGCPGYPFAPDPDNLTEVPGASFTEPEWRAVTTIADLTYGRHALGKLPLRRLRALRELDAIEILEARRPWPHLIELGFRAQSDGSRGTSLLRNCKALPNLRTLTVESPRPHIVKALSGSPVLRRVEQLGIEGVDDYTAKTTRALIAAAASSQGALRRVVVRLCKGFTDLGWRITLHREATGPFTRLVAWWQPTKVARSPKQLADDCVRILSLVDRSQVVSLSIEVGRPMRFPSNALRQLDSQLAEMPLEHRGAVVVPWQAKALKAAGAGELRWQLDLAHCNALERISVAWQVFGPDLGAGWNAMSVDDRGAPALGKDPAATLTRRAKGTLRKGLSLLRIGSSDAIELRRHHWVRGRFTTARPPQALATWFAGAVSALEPGGVATCGLADKVADINAFDLETYGAADAGWIIALPPATSKGLTSKHLTALGAIPVASPDRTRVVFTIGDDPSKVDDKRARAFAASLVEVLDELRAAKAPSWFAPAIRKAMAPIAKRLKLTKTFDHPLRFVWSRGKRFIRVRLDHTEGWMEIDSSSFKGGAKVRSAKDVATAIANSSHHLE